MSRTEFNRVTQQEQYQAFMEDLKKQRRIMFISNKNLISLIPQEYTAVLIITDKNNITVFIENKKPLSIKTAA